MTKSQISDEMDRIDKDGSGTIEKMEFMGFMAEII